MRAAMRAPARTVRSAFAPGPTQTMIRSATGHAASMPWSVAVLAHLRVDALGGAPQRKLAQRDQVALAEEVPHRARAASGM